ncbi:MAG: carboxymuconolactone decarboxylase family protein [Synechococcaceae cyanobacterium]
MDPSAFPLPSFPALGPDRMPPLPPEQRSEAQRQAAAALEAGPRGRLEGPFIPLLRSPELMDRLQETGAYLRFASALPERLREFVILLVARRWSQPVEWAIHCPLALAAGLDSAILHAVAEGRRPAALPEAEAIAYAVWDELDRYRSLSDATYSRTLQLLGEAGLIDLIALIGYYSLLAMVMNVAHTPASGAACL